MNLEFANTDNDQSIAASVLPARRFMVLLGAALFAIAVPAIGQNGELQQKLAAVKQAAAENKEQLRQYQWIETTQLTLKGDAKPSSQKLCQYGPDGQVQKTAIGPPPSSRAAAE